MSLEISDRPMQSPLSRWWLMSSIGCWSRGVWSRHCLYDEIIGQFISLFVGLLVNWQGYWPTLISSLVQTFSDQIMAYIYLSINSIVGLPMNTNVTKRERLFSIKQRHIKQQFQVNLQKGKFEFRDFFFFLLFFFRHEFFPHVNSQCWALG